MTFRFMYPEAKSDLIPMDHHGSPVGLPRVGELVFVRKAFWIVAKVVWDFDEMICDVILVEG